MAAAPTFAELEAAAERGDDDEVVRLGEAAVAARPGDDAAHELLARSLLALGRLDEAERHANDAVRIDPEEVGYRELLAEVLAARGAHRDAADEFARLARNDPRQSDWELAAARQRLGAAQPELGADAARRAVRLDPRNGRAQLALSQALARIGDAPGALQAADLLRIVGHQADRGDPEVGQDAGGEIVRPEVALAASPNVPGLDADSLQPHCEH